MALPLSRPVSLGRGLFALQKTLHRVFSSSSLWMNSENARPAPEWTPQTRRTGLLARKLGMTCLWDSDGQRRPVTVLHVDSVQVVAHKTNPTNEDYLGVVVGGTERAEKNTPANVLGLFRKQGISPKQRLAEFRVTPDAVVPVGTTLTAAHFVPGQYVDVQSKSIGKGFQGVMKRHGFKGLKATHGVSVSHRKAGSTGQHTNPGRTWKGRKMAGRMGGNTVTTQNLLVRRIDVARNIIYVDGNVPGPADTFVRVSDALKKVRWAAQARQKRLQKQDTETGSNSTDTPLLSHGVVALPMPAGSLELAKTLPAEIELA